MESTLAKANSQATKPLSYANNLLQPLRGYNLSGSMMLGNFTLDNDDYRIYIGKCDPNIIFLKKLRINLTLTKIVMLL